MYDDIVNVIKINVYKDGCVGSKRVRIGNKYENNITLISFNLAPELRNTDANKGKYYYAFLLSPLGKPYPIPLTNYGFILKNEISSIEGIWKMILIIKDTEYLDAESPTTNATFVSDEIFVEIENNFINKQLAEQGDEDPNLKLLYDDLLKLKAWLDKAIETDYYRGTSGKSPYIKEETGTWMVFNDETKEWIDTGIVADVTKLSLKDIEGFEDEVISISNQVITKNLSYKIL